jgi:hypothetical protein
MGSMGGDSKGPGGFGGPGGPEFTDKDIKNGLGEKHRENK